MIVNQFNIFQNSTPDVIVGQFNILQITTPALIVVQFNINQNSIYDLNLKVASIQYLSKFHL